MPGAYAHITRVNLRTDSNALKAGGVSKELRDAVGHGFRHCELGAVSPDLLCLSILDAGAKRWADHMHSHQVGQLTAAIAKGWRLLDCQSFRTDRSSSNL